MIAAYRVLVVLIGLRLLAPPGICLCHAGSPASRFVVSLLAAGPQRPPEEDTDSDDHEPGCPASPLAAGLGLQPIPVQVPPLLGCPLLDGVALASVPCGPLIAHAPLTCPPAGLALFLTDCLLLI